jgi:hypothetical protein
VGEIVEGDLLRAEKSKVIFSYKAIGFISLPCFFSLMISRPCKA